MDGQPPRKKQCLQNVNDESASSSSLIQPSTRSPLSVSLPGDLNLFDDDDDFFTSMDPSGAAGEVRPISSRIASASFFKNLDELKEREKAQAALSTSSATAAAAVSGGVESHDDKFASVVFRSPPLDWNLHSKIRFTSSHPFDWIERPDIEHEADGLASFLSTTSDSAPCSCLDVSPLRELHHALYYCTFPSMPFTKNHPLTGPFQVAIAKPAEQWNHTDQLAIAFVKRVWIQWEDAFRSLYMRLRLPSSSQSHLDHFYTLHRFPFAFTCLFTGAGPETGTPVSAVISRSNRMLRQAMMKSGVQFTMPNSNLPQRTYSEDVTVANANIDPISLDADAALQARIQQRKDEKLEKDEDLTPASVLLIQGKQYVHCLYDFLLHQDRRELNIPTLFASSTFLNGSTQQLNIVRVGAQIQRQKSAETFTTGITPKSAALTITTSSAPLQTEYALDIIGTILPASVVRLVNLLHHTQKGQFQAYFSSDFPGMNLNCVGSALVSGQLFEKDDVMACC